ncbi:MAG: tetraacyldisaccharide 4'-kinase [Nitrospinae bacterium RIFCSPLOWO2_01_FULL_39_10]|nr:MAG: tetraacyldisaccharide 4'-kinase [Nitrospinae bacterium RIFCSPLOWO2_01_FULL_39_10]
MNLFLETKNIMEGKGGNPILSLTLLILSWIYGFGHFLRLTFYRTGILKTKTLPVPVISIGNLTAGGTGKTPAVIMIAEFLEGMGKKVAVLSRGYKGKAEGEINVVSDGNNVFMNPLQSGDEPYMMAARLKGIPVITGSDRYKTGKYAIEKFGTEVILLDDGYQHVQLNRNLNILLLDSNSPFGNGYILPRGTLREPPSYINRSDVIILTKDKGQKSEVRSQKSEVCKSRYVSESFIDMNNNKTIALDEAKGKKIFAFCGIASPDSFKNSLKEAVIDIKGFVSFEDHYQFSRDDIDSLISKAKETGSEILITTEKDAVRLKGFEPISFPIWILKIRMEISEGKEILLSKIREVL